MPYVTKSVRNQLKDRGTLKKGRSPSNSGELNYTFTEALKGYIELKGLSYSTINDILGALEGAKLEFNRRIVIPYENTKINLNGDVY